MVLKQNDIIVSVCVQAFNHVKYIKECLESVLMQQTSFPFEIILGEDQSADGTREICIDYANKHPEKIKLFLRSRNDVIYINGNATGRYNFIENLKSCRGKYIALLEGDDYWTDPLKLQKQVDFLEGNVKFSGSFHNTLILNEIDGSNSFNPWRSYSKQVFTLEDTISRTALFHTSSFLFRKELLLLPNWFVKVQSGDMALFSLIASKGELYRIDEAMSVYRKNSTGITNTITISNYHKNRIVLFENLKKHLKDICNVKFNEVIEYHKKELLNLIKSKPKRSFTQKVINKIKRTLS